MLVCALAALQPLQAQPRERFELDLGAAKITIPAPRGFAEIAQYSRDTWSAIGRLTDPEQRVLGVFINRADIAAIERGQAPSLSEYAVLQTHAGTREMDLDLGAFNRLASQLRVPLVASTATSLIASRVDLISTDRRPIQVASATAIILINRRILSLIAYRRHQRAADLVHVQNLARDWISAVRRLNPPIVRPLQPAAAETPPPATQLPPSATR